MTEHVEKGHSSTVANVLPPPFLICLPDIFSKEGRLIYKGRNEVRVLNVNNQKISIKKYGPPPIFNRLLYSWKIRTPKALSSYQNAQKIIERGFKTALPLVYEIHYKNGILQDSYFVSSWLEGTPVSSVRKNGMLVRALARYTAELHQKGMMHRDYILNNVLLTKNEGTYQFGLIDVNRFIFQKGPLNWFLVCVNLMQPFPNDKQLKIFVTEYARARHINENVLAWWVLKFRHIRNGYSALKQVLRKLPGAQYFSRKAKRSKRQR